MIQKTLQERRELLRKHFNIVPGEFDFAKSSDSESVEEIQAFLETSVKDGCEGLMVKMLDSAASFYEPSRRSVNWLKVRMTLSFHLTIMFTLPSAQERLSGWRWRLSRPRRRRRLPRKRKAHKRIRRIPPRMLRPRRRRIPDHL